MTRVYTYALHKTSSYKWTSTNKTTIVDVITTSTRYWLQRRSTYDGQRPQFSRSREIRRDSDRQSPHSIYIYFSCLPQTIYASALDGTSPSRSTLMTDSEHPVAPFIQSVHIRKRLQPNGIYLQFRFHFNWNAVERDEGSHKRTNEWLIQSGNCDQMWHPHIWGIIKSVSYTLCYCCRRIVCDGCSVSPSLYGKAYP